MSFRSLKHAIGIFRRRFLRGFITTSIQPQLTSVLSSGDLIVIRSAPRRPIIQLAVQRQVGRAGQLQAFCKLFLDL